MRLPRPVRWIAWALGGVFILACLYLSVLFLPYPLFPHHADVAGFSVYSDGELPGDLGAAFEDARRRVEAMPLYRGATLPRIFVCRSQRRFRLLVRLAGKRHAGQGLIISAAGNVFLSADGIAAVATRAAGRPAYSRLEGSWGAAIAHEVAHHLVATTLGIRRARSMPAWKSEGYADYTANLAAVAADPHADLRSRIGQLVDDDLWRYRMASVDRRHYRWQLLVEYLCTVRGLRLSDLLADGVTEEATFAQMLAWYGRAPDEPLPPAAGG